MDSEVLETDTQCVIPPRNFYILTEDTILAQRNETLKIGNWIVASQQERSFGGKASRGALRGLLSR
jgi:hypothetical protein